MVMMAGTGAAVAVMADTVGSGLSPDLGLNFNVVVFGGARFLNNGPLIESINMALDVAAGSSAGEAEVYHRGVKVAGFVGGIRVFPARMRLAVGAVKAKVKKYKRHSDRDVRDALEQCQFNVSAAARLLGCSRMTIMKKVHTLGLKLEEMTQ